MTSPGRRIKHTGDKACPCEPVQAIVCDCAGTVYEPGAADPACHRCKGLGGYRLPQEVAPRAGMVVYYVCRTENASRYPLHEAYPPGDYD
jgi:DnaJ-class molecular chaperone